MRTLIFIICCLSSSLAQSKTFNLKKGQVLDVTATSFLNQTAAQKAYDEYIAKVIPLGGKHSFKKLLFFTKVDQSDSDFQPSGFGLWTWNSRQHMIKFGEVETSWPDLEATRPNYFKDLRIIHYELKKNITLSFSKTKIYEYVYLWLYGYTNDQQNLEQIHRLYQNKLANYGAKLIFNASNGDFETMNNDRQPDYLAIIEWPTDSKRKMFSQSKTAKTMKKLFKASVADIERFQVKPNIQ